VTTAKSWQEGKEIAEREGKELVFHNFDTGEYGACTRSQSFGCFKEGKFIEQRCICMPVRYSAAELEQKEREFLNENPDWVVAK
jgi:hypothetical protein